jgi:quercetin dioxygenase-like cupin family protein
MHNLKIANLTAHTRRKNMAEHAHASSQTVPALPPDDLQRTPALARPNEDQALPHIGLMGDTYTILLSGQDTAGRYCLIDMHVPTGGGPVPHRHDFEESFTVLEGEIEATVRGATAVVGAGETINIPANAPHEFHNRSGGAARLLCICAPSGQDEFFRAVGVSVATRTTPPPPLDAEAQAAFLARALALAPLYRTELLLPSGAAAS